MKNTAKQNISRQHLYNIISQRLPITKSEENNLNLLRDENIIMRCRGRLK